MSPGRTRHGLWSLAGAIVVCAASLAAFASAARAQTAELEARSITLAIDRTDIAVSGISSGAAMAGQLHLAHSKDLAGVGLVAGPPFRCADYFIWNQAAVPYFPFTTLSFRMKAALALCTDYYKTMRYGQYLRRLSQVPIGETRLQNLFRDAVMANRIDDRSGACGDRIFLISGTDDGTVPTRVTDASAAFYRWLAGTCGDADYVGTHLNVKSLKMPHTMPTDSPAEKPGCAAGPPYIANCGYAGAGEMLRFLHPKRGGGEGGATAAVPGNLLRFSQRQVPGADNPYALMHENGYLYVPDRCKTGAACSLHIALHGCHQNEDQINEKTGEAPGKYLFARDAGYNDAAERHGIVILYPQARNTTGWDMRNPNGCWDWWGYAGPEFYGKGSLQISAIWAMVGALTSQPAATR